MAICTAIHWMFLCICSLLSAVIAVTFIFAPEAWPSISSPWSHIQRTTDLSKWRLIGLNAEPNVPAKAMIIIQMYFFLIPSPAPLQPTSPVYAVKKEAHLQQSF